MYSVHLVINPPEGEYLDGLEEALKDAPFNVQIEERRDGMLRVWCHGIKPTGSAALPEALRLAQAGLSLPLKHHYPTYANRGGLLWSDVLSAEVLTTP